jgi:hypothetical protein
MHINDAQIDFDTGDPIVLGAIELTGADPRNEAIRMPEHRMIRLHLGSQGFMGLVCRPVIDFVRLDNGFCKAICAGPTIRMSIGMTLINGVLLDAAVAQKQSGRAWGGGYPRGTLEVELRAIYQISSFDLTTELVSEGLKLHLTGDFSPARAVDDRPVVPPPAGSGFVLRALVPWATLLIKGYRFGDRRFVSQGRAVKGGEEIEGLNPLRLQHLMIAEGLGWPYVFGRMLLMDASASRAVEPAKDFVTLSYATSPDTDSLSVSDTQRLQLLSNGFYRGSASTHGIRFKTVNKKLLDEIMRSRARGLISSQGHELGELRRQTLYGYDAGDSLGHIEQNIASFDLVAGLTPRGLHVVITGTLNDFDAHTFKMHKEQRNSTLQPWQRFSVDFHLPWALLRARDHLTARRQKEFVQSR